MGWSGTGSIVGPTAAAAAQPFMEKLRLGLSAVLLVLGDSTGNDVTEWVYLLAGQLAAQYPALTVNYRLWDDAGHAYAAPVVLQVGTGAGVLDVYNCSVAGRRTVYYLAPYFDAMVTATAPDVVVISQGHNESPAGVNTAGSDFRERMLALTETVNAACPAANIILTAQNPEAANTDQTGRAVDLARIASLRGYGLIDVHRAYVDTGTGPAYAAYLADGVHPNAAGQALWLTEAQRVFRYVIGDVGRSQQPSSLLLAGEKLFTNVDFALFTAPPAPPDGWTNAGCTASKDLVNYETLKAGSAYGLRLQATAAATASIYRDIDDVSIVHGQWVTAAMRVRIPAGQATTAGRINLEVRGGTGAVSLSSINEAQGMGAGFRSVAITAWVPTDATSLRLRIYCDSGAAGTGDITVDRVVITRGLLPAGALGSAGQPGATGATGPSGAGLFARKTANEARTTNGLANDAELVVVLDANSVYEWEAVLHITAATATPDFKETWVVAVDAAGTWAHMALGTASTTITGSVQMQTLAYGSNGTAGTIAGANTPVLCRGVVRTGATGGSLQLQWAQNVTDANGTSLLTDSHLIALKVA